MNKIIAIYIPSLRGGGAERAMVTLANAFASRGFLVDLVLVHASGPYLSRVSPLINIVDLKKKRVMFSLFGFLKYLYNRKPTVILSATSHINFIALMANLLSGRKSRIVVSERSNILEVNTHKKNFYLKIIRYLNRFLYRTADIIHAVSNGVADAAAKYYALPREKIKVVYNPVNTKQILELSKTRANFTWLPEDSRPLIIAMGRLTKVKDFSTLIKAFYLVRKKLDARLIIIGEGELRYELEMLISKHNLQEDILLPGFLKNPFVLIQKANLFVLSSIWEGFPNVLVEAMTCGTPVISTDCNSGPSEILENGKWGRLVPVGNISLLAKSIIDTLAEIRHPDVSKRASYFNEDKVVKKYLELLFPEPADV